MLYESHQMEEREIVRQFESPDFSDMTVGVAVPDAETVLIRDDSEPMFFRMRRLRSGISQQLCISDVNPFLPLRVEATAADAESEGEIRVAGKLNLSY